MKKMKQRIAKYVHVDIFDDRMAELCNELASQWSFKADKLKRIKATTQTT